MMKTKAFNILILAGFTTAPLLATPPPVWGAKP
jgi:hypothetical protein